MPPDIDKPPGRARSTFETLREAILAGRYPPGHRLPAERELAEQLGVNRGAVREAINRLVQARLTTTLHGDGTRVTDFLSVAGPDVLPALLHTGDYPDHHRAITSLAEMRTALSVDAARLAALRHTEAQLGRLRQRVRDLNNVDDDRRLQDKLQMIWSEIMDASGNLAYRLIFNTLRESYAVFDRIDRLAIRESFNAPDYRVLIDAIAQHDEPRTERGARRILEKHAVALLARL